METPSYKLAGLAVAFLLLAPHPFAFAQEATLLLQIKSFSVGPDQIPSYPSSRIPGLPDEHTTFMPPSSSTAPYLVFGASNLGPGTTGGAVVLETTDFVNFSLASSLGYTTQVMTPPIPINQCNPAYTTEFDGNYAAPGSVVQDPTLPAGNFIMIYEAENHCPGGVVNSNYYATTGFARSADSGKTWPAPINGVPGGPARHPVLQSSDPQPSVPHNAEGDAIPSAFVDLDADHNYYLYVAYEYHPASGAYDGLTRVARARLGVDSPTFMKWYDGSFSQPGIGGLDTGVTPSIGCGVGYQAHAEITYNDDVGLYLMIFVCSNGPTSSRVGAWYYSTASSLDLQNWTAPQMIQNSQFPETVPCPGTANGGQFDGWYPSTVSPGAAAGHTKLTGYFFFMNGCDTGPRQFMSRTFTIVTEPNAKQSSTIAFAPLSNVVPGAAPFAIAATASSGLPVSFASNTPVVCTVAGTTVTIVAAGTCSITASQAGNPNYLAATPVTQSFAVATASGASALAITNVQNAATFRITLAPSTYAVIFGQNLSTTNPGRAWTTADFTHNGNGTLNMPTSLDGTFVTIGGVPAYVNYISPGQINIITPQNVTAGSGVPVVVKVNGQVSGTFNITLQSLAPSFFAWQPGTSDFGKYLIAQHANGTNVGKVGLFPGMPASFTTPAAPGETIILYGTGFGPTNPPIANGIETDAVYPLTPTPTFTFGGSLPQPAYFGGLIPPLSQVYQFDVTIPSNAPNGDSALVVTVNGTQSFSGLITVQQ